MLNAQQVTSSMYIILNKFLKCKPTQYTRPLRNVSCHSEYLKNRWPDLDVPWQPVGGDLTGIHEQSLSAGARQSAVRCRWLNLCTVWPSHSKWPSQQISESASMRLPILQLSCRLFFWQNIASPRSLSTPTAQLWLPRTYGFPKAKNYRWKWGDLWMRWSHSTQAQSTASHYRLTSPTGEWLFMGTQ